MSFPKANATMTDADDFELVHGSGNVFRDLGLLNPALEQLRSLLAARIIKALDRQTMTVRKAQEWTTLRAADLSRVRSANFGRITVDRLMTRLARLCEDVEVTVRYHPMRKRAASAGRVDNPRGSAWPESTVFE